MDKKNIGAQLNVLKQCKNYGLPLYKCPQFLFLVMGVIIIFVILVTYSVGDKIFEEPITVLWIVAGEAGVLLMMGYAIISGFEKMAEVNQMKSDFVDLVTHQLRSPLTTLKWGFEDLRQEVKTNQEQDQYFESLQSNVEKMSEMVNNLLLLSRMDQEGHQFETKKFSINELLDKILEDYLVDENKDVEVHKKIEQVPKITSDPTQLEIVMDNFISNAIKYTPKGGQIEIRLKQKGKTVIFEVEDSGIGIPKNEQNKVFAKFERASNVGKVQQTGSGLGLFLTKEIITKLGGKIGFNSVEDKGSTFWFQLPIK